jgi:AraC family transcriptional regulator of adaptative response / DNA-3-methyladenine glycosylase II
MKLSREICRRAHETRDGRFDGRFFIGVTSTGVYCRPICPARTPKPENATYWPSAAAAAKAGFRPCRRCRPECAPGAPAALGAKAAALRALRLVEAGALDAAPTSALAARVGMTDRHLRRLFQSHFGAAPLKIAQTRRAMLAKSLIEGSDLSMGEIALAAGYRSLTRFNTAIKAAHHRPPTDLRRQTGAAPSRTITLSFAARPPFAPSALCAFYAARAIPGVGVVRDGVYHVATHAGGAPARLSIAFTAGGVTLEAALSSLNGLAGLIARVRRAVDLDCDPREAARILCADTVLARAFTATGPVRLIGHLDPFETLIRAILGQQVSLGAARTLAGRLAARWGERLSQALSVEGLTHAFPQPDALINAPIEDIGVTRARASAIRAVAAAAAGPSDLLDAPVDPDAWARRLMTLPGVGAWTAQYAMLRGFCEPDAFPAGDLILRRAYGALARGPAPDTRALARTAAAWRPLRGYAAQALWTYAHQFPDQLRQGA